MNNEFYALLQEWRMLINKADKIVEEMKQLDKQPILTPTT